MTVVMTRVTREHIIANRALPRERLRDRIFESAIDLFRRRGYDSTTIEAISKRAGVAKGTLFNFFPSKGAILLEHYRSLDHEFGRAMAAMPPQNPCAALVRFFGKAERLLRSEGSLIDDIVREIAVDATIRAADESSGRRDRAQWSEYVAACQAEGEIAAEVDPAVVGLVIADLWSGSVQEWIRGGKSYSLRSRLAAKLKVLFFGLEPRRRARRGN